MNHDKDIPSNDVQTVSVQRTVYFSRTIIVSQIISIGILIFSIVYMLLIFRSGIYTDPIIYPLVGIRFPVIMMIVVVIGALIHEKLVGIPPIFLLLSLPFFLCGCGLIALSVPFNEDHAPLNNHVYTLFYGEDVEAADGFILYECDRLSIVCNRIYNSFAHGYSCSCRNLSLVADKAAQTVSVIGEEGEIFYIYEPE